MAVLSTNDIIHAKAEPFAFVKSGVRAPTGRNQKHKVMSKWCEAHRLEKRGCFLFIFKELSTLGLCMFPALALICTRGFVLFWIWCCLVVWRSGAWLGFECPSQAHSESKIGSGICKFSSMDVCSEEHMHSGFLYSTHCSVSRMIKQWLNFFEIWSDGSMLEKQRWIRIWSALVKHRVNPNRCWHLQINSMDLYPEEIQGCYVAHGSVIFWFGFSCCMLLLLKFKL